MYSTYERLIRAIDVYLIKAHDDLMERLKAEGYAEPKSTAEQIDDLEETLAEAMKNHSGDVEDLLEEAAENSVDIGEFTVKRWKNFKSIDAYDKKLFPIFFDKFSQQVPLLANIYLQEMDSELIAGRISLRTSDWILQWSYELSSLMKLNSHKEIEDILVSCMRNGKGVEEAALRLKDADIRNIRWKARRVAQTEMLRAHSFAREEAIQQCPAVEYKKWVHTGSHKNKPRDNHVDPKLNGQIVPKDSDFTVIGADGVTYLASMPRAPELPAGETINCHCIHVPVVSEEILGMPLEERQRLQQEAIDEMDKDSDWQKYLESLEEDKKKRIGINEDTIRCDWLRNKTVEGRKKYFRSDSRWALFESGVIQNDKDLEKLYKTVDTSRGKRKVFKSLTELKNDGIITVSDKTLKHSTIGDFTNLKNPKKPPGGKNGGNMKGGGHSQANIEELKVRDWKYNIEKIFDNGVRIGNVPSHKKDYKKTGTGQAWFPENWTNDDVLKAGTYVANKGKASGITKFGEYNGIRVGIYFDENGDPSTIFPDNSKQP